MSFFEQLQRETSVARNYLLEAPVIQRTLAGDIDRDTYLAFLTEAYHHVKHTVPLMMAVGARLDERHGWLRTAAAEYIEEEIGHEEWILNDIRACGGDAAAVRSGTPAFATEMMVAYAYDTVQRRNPVGFFGMVQVLEGTSIQLATNAAHIIQEKLKLPQQAFSYLLSHGSLDLEHIEFFRSLMDRLDDPTDQAAVIHAAKRFYRLYGDVFRSLPLSGDASHAHAA